MVNRISWNEFLFRRFIHFFSALVDYTTFFSLLLSILLRLTITLGVSPAKNIVIFLHDFPFFSQSFHTVVFFFYFAFAAAAASPLIPFHVFAMISGTCVAFVYLPFFAQRFPTKRQLFYNSLCAYTPHHQQRQQQRKIACP